MSTFSQLLDYIENIRQSDYDDDMSVASTVIEDEDDNVEERRFVLSTPLDVVNRHPKDEHIAFQDEGHKYWIKSCDKNVISTTTLIKDFFEEFDKHGIIKRIMYSNKYLHDPTYLYYRKQASEIIDMWAKLGTKAAEAGSYNHLQIELYYNGQVADFTNKELHVLFKAFARDHNHLEPYRTEMLMFHEDLRITGSADMIFRNPTTGKFVLADWKFIKKLTKKCKSKQATGALSHLDDCNFTKYSLQLSIYRYILETEYGLEFEEQYLVILHKKQKKYNKVPTEYLYKEVEEIFDMRRKQQLEITNEKCSNA